MRIAAQERLETPARTKSAPLARGGFIRKYLINEQIIPADAEILFRIGNC